MILEQINANFDMVRHAINVEFITDKVVPNEIIMEDLYQPAAEMELRQRIPSLAVFSASDTLEMIVTQLGLSDNDKLALKLSAVFLIAAKLVFAITERRAFGAGEMNQEFLSVNWEVKYTYLLRRANRYMTDLGAEGGSGSYVAPVFRICKSEREING